MSKFSSSSRSLSLADQFCQPGCEHPPACRIALKKRQAGRTWAYGHIQSHTTGNHLFHSAIWLLRRAIREKRYLKGRNGICHNDEISSLYSLYISSSIMSPLAFHDTSHHESLASKAARARSRAMHLSYVKWVVVETRIRPAGIWTKHMNLIESQAHLIFGQFHPPLSYRPVPVRLQLWVTDTRGTKREYDTSHTRRCSTKTCNWSTTGGSDLRRPAAWTPTTPAFTQHCGHINVTSDHQPPAAATEACNSSGQVCIDHCAHVRG